MKRIDHPAQKGPEELLSYAIGLINRDTEFEQRIGYLLLDIGVEIMLKTYLELPNEVTDSALPYTKRQEAVKSNSFMDVLRCVQDSARNRLQGLDIIEVNHYHNRRNAIYHAGIGITIQKNTIIDYAKLACELMYKLLDVDIRSELKWSEENQNQQTQISVLRSKLISSNESIKNLLVNLEESLRLAVEKVSVEFVLPSFWKCFNEWHSSINFGTIHLLYFDLDHDTNSITYKDDTVEKAIKKYGSFYEKMPFSLQRFAEEYNVSTLNLFQNLIRNDPIEFYLWILNVSRNLAYNSITIYSSSTLNLIVEENRTNLYSEGLSEIEVEERLLQESEKSQNDLVELINDITRLNG